jgi:hypothetical protein
LRQSLLLIAAALLAFGLSLAGSFHFDDYAIFNDPDILSPAATRPLTNLTFWINEQAGGQNPVGYHVVNLLLQSPSGKANRKPREFVVPAACDRRQS